MQRAHGLGEVLPIRGCRDWRTEALTRIATMLATALSMATLGTSAFVDPPKTLIWNASAPIGLYQPQLGTPWFDIVGLSLYPPPAFFWWWYFYDAYAPSIFLEGALIAASGGFATIAVAISMSVWSACESKHAETYGSARWANPDEVKDAGMLGPDGVVLGRLDHDYLAERFRKIVGMPCSARHLSPDLA